MFALLAPRALWLAAAVVPLVLLYVLKTRRQRVRVASSAMFALARREASARDPWKRLVPEIALLLQILALLALVIAVARPVSRARALDADAAVVVLDRSASMGTMGTREGGAVTRMGLAKQAAHKIVAELGVGAEVGVVVAGRDARVVAPLGRERRAAEGAIDATEVGLIEGDVEPALDVARDLLRTRTGKRKVVLVTDGALARTPTWLDEEGGPTLDVVRVGAREGNVGIVRLDVRRGGGAGEVDRVEVGVVLAAYGSPAEGPPGGRSRYVTLRRVDRSQALDAQKVDLGASGHAATTLGFVAAADGSDELATLLVEISPSDALPLDDVAQIVVPPPRRMQVVFASLAVGGAAWVARALAADPDVRLTKVGLDRLLDTPIEPWSLVVVEDSCPRAAPGGGDVLVINPPPGTCAGRLVGSAVAGAALPPITSWSPLDPRLRYVDLDAVRLGRVVPLAPLPVAGVAAGADVARTGASALGTAALVRAEQLAVVADASTLDRTITLWGFDPADGDLARKAAFVLMVRDVVEVARARRDRSWAPTARAGIPPRVTAAAGAKEVVARRFTAGPGGALTATVFARAPVVEGVALIEGADAPGPYVLEGAATAAPLTVSLLSDAESDIERVVDPIRRSVAALRAAASASPSAAGAGSTATPVRARADFRWAVAAIAALFLALDALWLTRRGRHVVALLGRRAGRPSPSPSIRSIPSGATPRRAPP